jgi:hypothetical protein
MALSQSDKGILARPTPTPAEPAANEVEGQQQEKDLNSDSSCG